MKKTSAKPGARLHKPDSGELAAYRLKRDPAQTNEPFAAERTRRSGETRGGRFVVHLHAATRTHYDLRLQIGGTLKSFAVPRGPSLNPDDKRLAVQTEDHPLEYLDFEEVIPAGNYGAGAMIAWDLGRVRYLDGSAELGVERGKLDFELHGFKLCGRFALVHTGKRATHGADAGPEWLLFKKPDAFSSTERDILSERPESVLSGLAIDELGRKRDLAAELEAQAEAAGAPLGAADVSGMIPMLCASTDVALDDPARVYELKLDGVRIVADKHGGVALRYRNGRAASASYPEIARAVRALAPERVVLDGEIIAFDERGKPSFQRLASRIHAQRPHDVLRAQVEIPVVYVVFDLLAIGGRDLRPLPLHVRRQLLSALIRCRGLIRLLDAVEGGGRDLLQFCNEQGLEGVVAKRADAPYRPGPRRSEDWVKVKCAKQDEFVITGWITGKGKRTGLGALDLASYSGERLLVRGKVGSGLDERVIRQLLERLAPLEVHGPPAEGELTRESGTRHFVRPEVVASVQHMGWTEDCRLRHPVFRGLREDVDPSACRAAPEEELISAGSMADSPATASAGAISNPDKVFWPEEGYTKRNLCEYYAAVAPVMLPFLRGRPVVLVRYPDGVRGKHFYQWRAPEGVPSWIRTLELRDEEARAQGESKSVFLLDSVEALVYVANLGCIPVHVLASTERSLDECGFLTIDLDIGAQPFKSAVVLALSLREVLDELGLSGFPKTSGQKGLHVLVPMPPGVSFEAAKLLVELLGRLLEAKHPRLATMERRISKRGPRVYIDTGQTGRSRTIVAPYSVRAHPGATVSTPLSWEEVHVGLDPARFNMLTLPGRIAELGDPMAAMLDATAHPSLALALERLEQKLSQRR